MKKIFALLLSLLMVLSFAACGDKKDDDDNDSSKKNSNTAVEKNEEEKTDLEKADFEGKWNYTLDMGATMEAALKEEGMECDFATANVKGTYTFNEDGTFLQTTDADAVRKAMASVKSDYSKVMKDALTEEAKKQGTTYEELLAQSGGSLTALVDAVFSDAMIEQMEEDVNGKWKFEDDKFFMTNSEDEEFDDDDYLKASLKGDTLTLTEVESKIDIVLKRK